MNISTKLFWIVWTTGMAGLAAGVPIVLVWVIAKPFLTQAFVDRGVVFNTLLPHPTRFP